MPPKTDGFYTHYQAESGKVYVDFCVAYKNTTSGDVGADEVVSGKNAPIVILDEATAFTDPENEDKLQRSIAVLTKGKTLLVIAHRLSTIKNADNIVVLKNGAIEAAGTQEELLASCPLYKDMWLAHIGAQNWAVSAAEKEA